MNVPIITKSVNLFVGLYLFNDQLGLKVEIKASKRGTASCSS
jgi:hypothetical protein